MSAPLLEVDDLYVSFAVAGAGLTGRGKRILHAVNGVSFSLAKGECLSIVGESGCGKTTTALSVMGLKKPTKGEIRFRGRPMLGPFAPTRMERAKAVQIVFQDPYASLNPRHTVWKSLADPLWLHGITTKSEIADRIAELLRTVGLTPEQAQRFPHEFSGGQRQRIGIARALILEPEIVVLDEPVSALDVSIRAQIINLLLDLQDRFGLSYLMISHDLSVVEHMSDRVMVMYFGQMVETGSWQQIFSTPAHPYTKRLIAAIPDPAHFGKISAEPFIDAPNMFAPPDTAPLSEIAPGHFIRPPHQN